MPTWKKVVISGSGVAQLSNDANYLVDAQSGAILSGSFTGSFVGDGSGLTNIVAPGTISASAQVVVQDTTGFSGLEGNISASISDLSGSAHTARTSVVSDLSGSAHTARNSQINDLSGSAHTARNSQINDLSGSAHTQRVAIAGNLTSDISSLSGSAHTQRTALISNLSSSVDAHLDANISALSASSATAVSSLSGSAHSQRVAISASIANTLASNNSDLTDLIASQSAFDTAFILSGQNATVRGNLTVAGTTTTVNSETIDISGSLVRVNYGGGAVDGGLEVTDATLSGLATGSLLWDGTNNYWKGGEKGSEIKILRATGDSVVSGSTQITISDTTGYTAFSQSIDTHLDSNISALSASVDAHLDANISALSASVDAHLDSNISALSASVDAHLDANISALSASVDAHLDANISAVNTSISNLSASVDAHLDANISALSSSVDTHLDANISALSGSAHTQRTAISASFATTQGTQDSRLSALETFTGSLDASYVTEEELAAATSSLSSSAHTARNSQINDLSGSAHTQRIAISSSLKNYTDSKIADLVNGAPALLDTLDELALAIGDDPNMSASFAGTLATKASITQLNSSGSTLQGNIDTLSGSAHTQRTALISALSSSVDAHLDANISALSASVDTHLDANISALSGSAHTQRVAVSASFATTQAAQDTRISNLETFSSSLDANYATEAELNTVSASVKTYADNAVDTLSGSAHTQRTALISALSSSVDAHLDANISALSSSVDAHLDANISSLSGSSHTQRVAISSSFATTISGLSQTLSISGSTGNADIDLKSQDLTISGDGGGITTSISGQTISLVSNGIVSASAEGDAQGQIKLNGVNVNINALGTNDSPTFQNLTINGNLSTLGTVTNVNTTDLNIEDKFILLNSGSASGNSGLIVQNSATIGQGTALFYDDTENRWGLDHVGADAVADTATADSYVAAVTTDDTDTNLQKNGNIYVDTVSGEAFIYVA